MVHYGVWCTMACSAPWRVAATADVVSVACATDLPTKREISGLRSASTARYAETNDAGLGRWLAGGKNTMDE